MEREKVDDDELVIGDGLSLGEKQLSNYLWIT